MSKRGAADYITKDGIGSMTGEDGPSAQRATAAQIANRKIAAARPRTGARRHGTPGASSGFTSSTGFGGATSQSQSFPPINGAPSIGNGAASASFGGFGSGGGGGGGGGGFNFSAGGSGFNNPFAQQNAQQDPLSNGGGGGMFGFGGGQPQQQSSTAFQFGGGAQQSSQQPPSNMFGASQSQPTNAFGGFGSSQQQPTTNMFGASTSQPQSSAPAFGGFGASASAPTTTTNMFGGAFGATAGPTQQAPSFGGFGQQPAQPAQSTPGPSFTPFGQPPPAFGQPNADMSMSTPESSPQKPLGWNKQAPNGVATAPKAGGESPDRPPHVEQEGEALPNPFANLKRMPPQPAPAPTPKAPEVKPPTNDLFNFGKLAQPETTVEAQKEPDKEKEKEKQHPPDFFTPEKKTPAPASSNPFASIQRMPSPERPSLFSSTPQAEQPKPASTPSFFNTSSTPQPAPSATTQPSTLFQPKTSLSNFFSPDKSAETGETPAATPSNSVNIFSQAATPAQEPSRLQFGAAANSTAPKATLFKTAEPQPFKPHPAPATPASIGAAATPALPRSELFALFLPEIMREDNLPAPAPGQDLNAEEKKLYYSNLKIARLNKVWALSLPQLQVYGDLSPFMGDYAALLAEIKKDTKDSRLGQLYSTHGETAGQRLYDQEQGRLPADGTNKRKAAPAEDEEKEKRAKVNGELGGSSTVNKFQSILGQSTQQPNGGSSSGAGGLFGASAGSPAPAPSSNLFAKAAPAAQPSSSGGLFAASSTSAAPSTTNMFGSISAAPAATPASSSTSNLFAKAATPANGTTSSLFSTPKPSTEAAPTPTAGSGFKPTTSSTTDDAVKPPSFGGFKPTLSSGTTASSGPPKFGGGGGASFMNQFAKNAEETAKKERQKAFDDDYDSDEETKEQWFARYDKAQEEKKKKLAAASAGSSFKFTPTSSVAGSNAGSGDEAEPKGFASFLAPPAANNFFSRSASPASVTGSVFDQPRASTPISKDNPFANLSSQQPSEKGDADDEDEGSAADADEDSPQATSLGLDGTSEQEEDDATPKPNGIFKRKGPFEEDDDSQSETPVKQTRTDGLFGRISRDGDRTPLASTGANTSSLFSTSAAADQTWTPKDPIKFASTNASSDAESGTTKKPLFSFTPANSTQPKSGVFSGLFSGTQNSAATSGAATPSNPFASLTTPAAKLKAGDSLLPPPSGATSVFSSPGWSRATTPGPSDISGAESTAGEEETKSDAQIDIADLANDTVGADVLFQAPKVKATDFAKEETETKKKGWNIAGVGPIAIFTKDDVTSLLMRAHPSGKIVLNTRLSSVLNPEPMKKRVRMLVVTGEGPQSYVISFQTEEEASSFADACKANGAK